MSGVATGCVVALLVAVSSPAAATDTVGLVETDSGRWHLFDESFGRFSFFFGDPGDIPFVGDWDCDGVDTPGLFRASDAFVYLRNANSQGIADVRFFFGNPDDVPIVGDFNGDGCDTVSIYRPSVQRFFIVNTLGANDGGLGAADYDFGFGDPGDKPVTGDWDNDGITEVGLHRESTGLFYWRNTLDTGTATGDIIFGDPNDRFVSGDWGGTAGFDSPAVFRPSDETFYFRHTLTQGNADRMATVASLGSAPVAGDFGRITTVPRLALEAIGTFSSPLLVAAPAGDHRLFVVERGGSVKVVDGGAVSTFLTVAGVKSGGEQGLLGMAFHPTKSLLYVSYTNSSGDSVLAEYSYSSGSADPGSRRQLLTVDQPASNHNGGMVAFGPDGYLYWGLGDGGGGGDPFGNGQDPATLLGSILRIDPDGGVPYAVPPGNPFVGGGGAAEVFLYGVRNPWRFSFDGSNLYVGDVGQDIWEEVSVVDISNAAGANLGWNRTEGAHCFGGACSFSGITLPVAEYSHDSGCSVTGGYVYRGSELGGLAGTYLYGDFCSGRIWSLRLVGGVATDQMELTPQLGKVPSLASFGTDGFGELYVVSLGGTVYKLVAG
jgi:hypothetical protein